MNKKKKETNKDRLFKSLPAIVAVICARSHCAAATGAKYSKDLSLIRKK